MRVIIHYHYHFLSALCFCHRIASVPLLPPPTPIGTIGPVWPMCAWDTGTRGAIMTASSAHSPSAAGVFIFRLTLKHKAIHHRAPLPPRPRPRDTAPRYEDTRPGAAASITVHTELSGGNFEQAHGRLYSESSSGCCIVVYNT